MAAPCSGYPNERSLAQGLLAADQPERERAWRCFDERCRKGLLYQAREMIARTPVLRSRTSEEDLVQGFLADKVMPNRETFFDKVARGDKQGFLSLLKRSFTNYAIDMARRREPAIVHDDPALEDDGEGRGTLWVSGIGAGEVTAEPERHYQRLLSIIHHHHASFKSPAHYLAVLLAERVRLVKVLGEAPVDLSEYGIEPMEWVEALVCWPAAVGQTGFDSCGLTLDAVWEALRPRMQRFDTPKRKELAQMLGVNANTLDQWVSRGRKVLWDGALYDEIVALAPYWFSRGTPWA